MIHKRSSSTVVANASHRFIVVVVIIVLITTTCLISKTQSIPLDVGPGGGNLNQDMEFDHTMSPEVVDELAAQLGLKCYDSIASCKHWVSHGSCEKNLENIGKFCRKSCNICVNSDYNKGVEQEVAGSREEQLRTLRAIRKSHQYYIDFISDRPTTVNCHNDNVLCAFWAGEGECKKENESYMQTSCSLACQVCTKKGGGSPPPGKLPAKKVEPKIPQTPKIPDSAPVTMKPPPMRQTSTNNNKESEKKWSRPEMTTSKNKGIQLSPARGGGLSNSAEEARQEALKRHFESLYSTDAVVEVPARTASKYEWPRLLSPGKKIIASGNIWPRTPHETKNDCLLLLTHSSVLRHCPNINMAGTDGVSHDEDLTVSDNTVVVYHQYDQRIRGAFEAPGTEGRRLWLLVTPHGFVPPVDYLKELDTLDGRILQTLKIPESFDGHDAVKAGNSTYIVNSAGGCIDEVSIPPSAQPYTAESIAAGAKKLWVEGYVNILHSYKGFFRVDHINNVAIHDDILFVSVHGGVGIKNSLLTNTKTGQTKKSETRFSGLARDKSVDNRELNYPMDGFPSLVDTGMWCHNIAFYTNRMTGEVLLVYLDSAKGALVAVILTGMNLFSRYVLWEPPNPRHIALVPPPDLPETYRGADNFAKGLAVQDDTVFFGVSFARDSNLRRIVPYTLLVAVDLITQKEIFARTIRSNGLINQIISESYLGYQIRVPEMTVIPTVGEVSFHCVDEKGWTDGTKGCANYAYVDCQLEADMIEPKTEKGFAREACCICGGGKRKVVEPKEHRASFNEAYLKVAESLGDSSVFDGPHPITATVRFTQPTTANDNVCHDVNSGMTKRLSLEDKTMSILDSYFDIETLAPHTVRPICMLDVSNTRRSLGHYMGGNNRINLSLQNAVTVNRDLYFGSLPSGADSLRLIYSSNDAKYVYHFPWLGEFLHILRQEVLDPLGIEFEYIYRMEFVNMATKGKHTELHEDSGAWATTLHHVHVPILTQRFIYFNVVFDQDKNKEYPDVLRIKSDMGDAFEFNNVMKHYVQSASNDDDGGGGGGRKDTVHLIIDYGETKPSKVTQLKLGDVCKDGGGDQAWSCENADAHDEF